MTTERCAVASHHPDHRRRRAGVDVDPVGRPPGRIASPRTAWGVRFADTVLATWPDPAAIDPAKNGWEYNTGIVLFGMSKMYDATKDPRYLDYIKRWVDGYVNEQGVLGWDQTRTHNLDYIQPGMLVLFLYERTGDPRYKAAAKTVREAFDRIPKNADGGFWHKGIYPNEMWIDGIYMGEPFLVNYGRLFDDAAFGNDMAVVPVDAGRAALSRPEDRPALSRVGPGPERGVGRSEDRAIARHLGPRHGLVRDGHGRHPRAAAAVAPRLPAPARTAEEERRRAGEGAGPEDGPLVPGHGPAGACRATGSRPRRAACSSTPSARPSA